MELLLLIIGAFVIDLIIGDPRGIPHPVAIIGKLVEFLEKNLHITKLSPRRVTQRGALLVLLVLLATLGVTLLILYLSSLVHSYLYYIIYLWLLASTLSVKGLGKAGQDIFEALQREDLVLARKRAGEIVGRDTNKLEERGLSRAAVETVAENTVDGITAPLFYAFIGGLPLAIVYKAINTLDSMLGYKNEKYRHFGWAAARLDDLANYIPARLTALIMLVSSGLLNLTGKVSLNWKRAWKVLRTDARNHPSLNSGYSEALMAGALGIQLGGTNYYQGIPSRRPLMGIKSREIEPQDITAAVKLMYLTSVIALASGIIVRLFV